MKLIITLALVAYVLAAPVQEKDVDKRRESTKETIELENTLKRLAGENKKFFSNPMQRPMPQVDGLEEKGSGEVEEEPAKSEEKVALNPLEEQLQVVEASKEQEQPQQQNEAETEETMPVDQALEDEIEAAHYPIPGPYGPGFESSHPGSSVEYEPMYIGEDEKRSLHDGQEEEEEEEEPQDEEYFLGRVMETLRRHPELLNELMSPGDKGQENLGTENGHGNMMNHLRADIEESDLQSLADYDDRYNAIQAELATIRAQSDPNFAAAYQQSLANTEKEQSYLGDKESHIVAKKKSLPGNNHAIPKEYVEDNIDALNRYFDTYADDDHGKVADVPIM